MTSGRRVLAALLAASLAVGCLAAPASPSPASGPPRPSTIPMAPAASPLATLDPGLGEALPEIERPGSTTCNRLQREDLLAARRIRTSVDFLGLDIGSDAAIEAAADDRSADLELLGIPLRPDEVAQLRASGMFIDNMTPMAFWVNEGRVDLFGGIWVDPPGSSRGVVSVVGGSREALELARCLERADLEVRYVMATHSVLELRELQERINRDWASLEQEGIRIVSTGQDSIANRVSVEIEGLTDEIAKLLSGRYGDGILLESVPVPTPYVPLTLDDVPFAMGTDWLFSDAGNDGRRGPRGTWELADGRVADGKLHLSVVIEPPPYGLPVASGPAVLFAGMEAFGGAGDVGFSEPIHTLETVALPACNDVSCRFEAEVTLPTDEIMPAVRRLEEIGEVSWLTVNMTLVRTFAGGTWLQVLPLDSGSDGGVSGAAGRLGAIDGVAGTIFPFGLFPAGDATAIGKGGTFAKTFDYARAVERRRRKMGDTTQPIPMAPATLHVEMAPTCKHAAHVTVHTDAGDHVFDAGAYRKRSIDGRFQIPAGTTWRVTLHDGGGIDFDQGRQGWGVRVGEIRSDGSPIMVNATFACDEVPSGTIELVADR